MFYDIDFLHNDCVGVALPGYSSHAMFRVLCMYFERVYAVWASLCVYPGSGCGDKRLCGGLSV